MLYEGRKDIPLIFKVCDPCAVFKSPGWLSGKYTYPGQDNIQVEGERAIRFLSHAYGVNAGCRTLLGYQSRGLNTVRAMITEYAPPSENLTETYIKTVSSKLKVQPTDPIDVRDERTLGVLIRAIIKVECGPVAPKDLPSNWVEESEINKGVQMALGKVSTAPPTLSPITDEEARNMFVPLDR